MNVLLVTLDQFRGDCLSCAGHPVVRTPHLDDLARDGVRLAAHYSQAAPCAPGRASLYTGLYAMNHRVVANGTPLDDRFDNVARLARRAGYTPTLFGYTDQTIDPRCATGPDDPRLRTYEGVLPGFDVALDLTDDQRPWLAWLAELGHDPGTNGHRELAREPERPAQHGVSAFLTDHLIDWIERQDGPWFAHASYLRPHPPYAAAGHWSRAYDPADVDLPLAPSPQRHQLHELALAVPGVAAPQDEGELRRLRAQYYGMIGDVDAQLGRVWEVLRRTGQWDETLVIVTADHGEQLGDHGLLEKLGYFEASYHIVGIVRDPRHPTGHGSTVDAFTENVDVLPTICDALDLEVPTQCDGLPLTPFLAGTDPPWWRDAAHWEYDWRDLSLAHGAPAWPWDRRLERHHLAVTRTRDAAYVQFGDASWLAFDLAADPTWRTTLDDPATVLALAQTQLVWRGRHAERTMSSVLVTDRPVGRLPLDVGALRRA
ncbi:MAG: sulfatase-like hydrolase/transferase [Acidimicrobiales bacterium]|nr:sulfatase-like hydrolase/transferase [Acidimicrobiales bacterium]